MIREYFDYENCRKGSEVSTLRKHRWQLDNLVAKLTIKYPMREFSVEFLPTLKRYVIVARL